MEKVAQTGAVDAEARRPQHAGRGARGSAARRAVAAAAAAPAEPWGTAPTVSPAADAARPHPRPRPLGSVADATATSDEEERMPAVADDACRTAFVRCSMHSQGGNAAALADVRAAGASSSCAAPSKASTSASTALRRWSICFVPPARRGVLRIERDRQGAVRVFPGINLMERPRSVDMNGLPVDVEIDDDAGNRIEPGNGMGAAAVEEAVTDLPIVDAQVDPMMADADDEPQPFFAPEPVEEADSDAEIIEDDGPQPGNEIRPSGAGRRRAGSGAASRPARGGRSAKTAKPRTPAAARAPRASGARKTPRGRGRG